MLRFCAGLGDGAGALPDPFGKEEDYTIAARPVCVVEEQRELEEGSRLELGQLLTWRGFLRSENKGMRKVG